MSSPHPRPSLAVWRPARQTVSFSDDQAEALDRVVRWRNTWPRGSQTFTLGGLAGTGKTTIVAALAEEWPDAAVACLAGKAADVLRGKGVDRAQTIHSLIYDPYEDALGHVQFRRRHHLATQDGRPAGIVIIDEASMVSRQLLADLLDFRLPVLFVGDHGQLEPVGDDPGLMASPDVRLERIHRQAEGNPIIAVAHSFREGKAPACDLDDGRVQLLPPRHFNRLLVGAHQVIVGFNKTRHSVNQQVREALGRKSELPVPFDRLVCLRNNRTFGVFNGQQADVIKVRSRVGTALDVEILTEDGRALIVPMLAEQFGADALQSHRDPGVCLFDYGYALTAHKAQGSEWSRVLVLEQIGSSWDARRWRYTAATRAKERLTYCGYAGVSS